MTINLQELGAQLEQTAKAIEAKVKNTDTRFNIGAAMLVKKVPELKSFEGLTVFQARWTDDGLRIEIPRVCRSIETEDAIIQLPDLEYLSEVKYINYVTGLGGYAVVEIGKQQFQIGLIANLDLEDDLNAEGKGKPPVEVLGFERRPEIPLKSDAIPLNVELIVISNGKKSREYNTAMCDVKIAETGEIIKNVLCNTQLERLIEKYGSTGDCRFKVTKKTKVKDDKTKVSILDLNGVDFSDLEI